MSATAHGLAAGSRWHQGRVRARIGLLAARVWDEWRWPVLFSLVLSIVLEVPFRLAASHTRDGLAFVGMLWSLEDASQYVSAMSQGASTSSWLVYNHFSQEPHRPVLLYTGYVALGKLAWLLGAGHVETFMAASTIGRPVLLLAAYLVTRLVSDDRTTRRTALVLMTLASGLTVPLLLLKLTTGLDVPLAALEREHPELNTFLALMTAPHLLFSLALLLLGGRVYADCWSHPLGWRQGCLGLLVLALGLINPFGVVAFAPVVAAHAAIMLLLRRRLDWSGHGAAVVVGLVALPIVLVNVMTFAFDPFWGATFGAQNVLLAPPPWDMLLALGLLVPFALLGLPTVARSLTPGRLLVLVWIVASLILMHAPTGTQRRFALGLHPMLALVGVYGVLIVMRWLQAVRSVAARLARVPLMVVTLLTLFSTSIRTWTIALLVALAPNMGYTVADLATADHAAYHPASVTAAAAWLAEHEGPDDVVLASNLTGNYLAGIAPGRVYTGQWVATLHFDEKKARASWFYAAPLDGERRAFLLENGFRYVFYGPHERALGDESVVPRDVPPVYAAQDVTIFDARALATRPADGRQP
jgi:hypothetical protein